MFTKSQKLNPLSNELSILNGFQMYARKEFCVNENSIVLIKSHNFKKGVRYWALQVTLR